MKKINFYYLIMFVWLIPILSCELDNTEPEKIERGKIESYHELSTITSEMLSQVLYLAGVEEGPELKYDIKIVSVVYNTIDIEGNMTEASGAIFVPITNSDFPLLSFQHGTQTKSDEVASKKGITTLEGLAGAVAASMGFIASVPDYLGLGTSDNMLHPYLHKSASASCVIDMLRATQNYCNSNAISHTGELFMGGYSEGGFVTLAAQNEIEQHLANEFTITASAPMAGPYDLQTTIDEIFDSGEYAIPGNAAYLALAYNSVYNLMTVDEIFKAPYASKVESLFDGSKKISEINGELTTVLADLFTDDFMNNYINNTNSEFRQAIEENTLINVVPTSLTRFYHGDADDVVPYINTENIYNKLTPISGVQVEMVVLHDANHETAAVPSVIDMLHWFNNLRAVK